jgi:hypothetical protein
MPPRRPPAADLATPAARPSVRPVSPALVGDRRVFDEPSDDGEPIRRPGSLGKEPVAVPGEFLKSRTVAPRTGQPDFGVDLSERTSVGVFGDVRQIAPEDIRTHGVKPTRDLGAGVTIQYKFGLD